MGDDRDMDREKWLDQRLTAIYYRVKWIADSEARSSVVRGMAARGSFTAEKEQLLDKVERVLDEFSDMFGADSQGPRR